MLEESIALFQQLDDPVSQSMLLDSMNTLLNIRGQFADLLPVRQKRLVMAKELGDRRMIGYTQAEVGETLCHLGHYSQAEAELRNGLAMLKTGFPYEHALWQQHLANVLLVRGQYEEAYELCRSSLDFFRSIGEKGWASTTLASLSHAEFALGRRAEAWEHTCESLHLLNEIHLFAFFIPRSLAILAVLYIDQGKLELAHELQTQISLQSFWKNSHWYADLYGNPVKATIVDALAEDRTTTCLNESAHDLWEIVKILIPKIRP
jgi:tetratricopeptide (TPR) repeat protein